MRQGGTNEGSKKKNRLKRASKRLATGFCHSETIPQKPQQNRTFWKNGYPLSDFETKRLGGVFRAFQPEALFSYK